MYKFQEIEISMKIKVHYTQDGLIQLILVYLVNTDVNL